MLDVACSIALTLSYITNRRAQRSSQNTRQRAGSSFVGITLLLPCAIMLSTQITIWSPRTTQSQCRCLCLTTQRGHGVLFGRRLSFRPPFVFSVVFSMQLIGGFLNSVCMCRSLWIHTSHLCTAVYCFQAELIQSDASSSLPVGPVVMCTLSRCASA